MESLMESFRMWVDATRLSAFMGDSTWAWQAAESLHFVGLSFLIGAVGLFDLRMMGFAKAVPVAALHRLIPWGVLGYAINVITGISFFSGAPDQYMYNPAFQFKILFMMLAGINILVFYSAVHGKVALLGAGDDAPPAARIIGGVSLVLWIGVIICGRLLTFYRPPMISCPWC